MVRGRKRQYPKSDDKSATSSSFNNNIIKDDRLGFVNETLDFEPDDLEDDNSTRISTGQNNLKTFIPSYTSEMISLNSIEFPDGRQEEYIPALSNKSSRIIVDSTSDSSSLSSSKVSHRDNDDISDLNEDVLENESLYSMTAEDENKLLESSDDEDHIEEVEEVPFRNDYFKNKVVLGENNQIIIKTLFHSNDENVKRFENERVRETCPRRKKKKWDLSFNPPYSPIQLYLQDIGYSSQSDEEATDSVAGSTCSESHTITSFKVTCSDEERVCQQVEKVSSHSRSSVSSDEMNFKVPLPPVKRPPTRPRRQDSVDSSSDESSLSSSRSKQFSPLTMTIVNDSYSNSSKHKTTASKEDDSISLIASSLGGVDNLEENTEERAFSYEKYPNYLAEREPFVRDWVENVPSQPASEWNGGVSMTQEQEIEEPVPLTVAQPRQYPPVDVNGKPRIDFKDVPSFFHGLCYYKYINGRCARELSCQKAHWVERDKFQMKAKKLTPQELLNVYQFLLSQDELYKAMHLCFVNGFGHHQMQTELVACIKDFFRFQGVIDVSQAIEETVRSLENTGLTFLEAVDKISFNVGFMQFPLLADILLELVTRKKSNVSDNWEMIKRICKAKEKIPADIARRILVSSISGSYNRKLCLEVYDVIIKNNATDLTQIEDKILAPFRTLTSFKTSSNLRGTGQLSTDDNHLPSTSTHSTITSDTDFFVRPDKSPVNRDEVPSSDNQSHQRSTFERSSEPTSITTLPARICNFATGKITARVANTATTSDNDTYNYVPRQYVPPIARNDVAAVFQSEELTEDERHSTTIEPSINDLEEMNFSLQWSPPNGKNYVDDDEESKCGTVYLEPDFLKHSDLFPDQPIIGKRCYNKHFKREKSLHNLLCNPMDMVDMHETDVKKLNNAIKKSLAGLFLELLYKYNRKETITNFITMTLAHLKSCHKTSQVFDALLESCVQFEPNFTKIRDVKGILEVIVMNILFEYEKRGFWKEAAVLVERFCDWDSLVSSKVFSTKQLTDMGKYLYLAKTCVLGKKYHLAYEILQCPNLRILESVEKWPYFCHSYIDLELRNAIFTDFFNQGFQCDINVILAMYRNIFRNGGIHKYNIYEPFNHMLITVIDEQEMLALKSILKDIDVFYKEMDRNLLRAFTIIMESQIILQEKKFRLYEFCCLKNIYTQYKGDDTNITVRVNMLDVEIRFILLYFFNKLSSRSEPPNNCISIDIKLQDCESLYPRILLNTLRSIKQVNDSVRTILSECFELPVCNTESTSCVISASAVTNWWQSNKI